MKKITLFMITICMSALIVSNIQAADLGNIETHGFISQGYLQTDKHDYLADTKDGSYQFNEMGINFNTFVADDLKVGLQLYARDMGEVGNDEVVLNWAFAEYNWRDWMGFRAGLVKFALGFYNDTRDMDMLRTSIFLPSSVYNEWLRDGVNSMKGYELFGNISLGSAGTLKYQLQTGETQIPLDSGTIKFIEQVNNVYRVNEIVVNKIYNSAVQWITPLDGLRLGFCYAKFGLTQEWDLVTDSGNEVSFDNKKNEYITYSIEYTWNNLVVAAEKWANNREADMVMHLDDTWAPILTGNPAAPANDYTVNKDNDSDTNYYVSASYRFTDLLELGTYYSFYENNSDLEPDTELEEQKNELTDICLSARFDINDNWIIKLEGHKMEGLFGVQPEDGKTFEDGDEDWYLYAAKMTFSF